MPKKPLAIDGTTLEGGGQLFRLAVGLSALTSIPIQVDNIRGKRSGGGGLKWQHLASVNWLAEASNADMEGNEHKSKKLVFEPSPRHFDSPLWAKQLRCLSNGTEVVDLRITQATPGSIGLVFQAILPYILFSGHSTRPVRLTIAGGSNVTLSPSFEYMKHVLLPTLNRIGTLPIEMELEKRGWTTGRTEVGSVKFLIHPFERDSVLDGFSLTNRGEIDRFEAVILAPLAWEKHFTQKLRSAVAKRFQSIVSRTDPAAVNACDIKFEDSRSDKRLYLLLIATSKNGHKLARDCLWGQKINPNRMERSIAQLIEHVIDELAIELAHGGCVDEYMRDQLVVFQALAKGESKVSGGVENGVPRKPSLHTHRRHSG